MTKKTLSLVTVHHPHCKSDNLVGHKPSDRQLMPCYGSLQREKTWLD